MRVLVRIFCLSLFIITSITATGFAQNAGSSSDKKVVTAIEVVGNKTISIATILSKIKTRVGQNYLQTVISDDLKRLYNTGYFADVRVDREEFEGGFKVVILVDEKAIIEEITFSKTKKIRPNAIKKQINSQVGKFLDNKVLKDDVKTIRDMFDKKGMSLAEVEVETFIDDVTNKVSLHFIIREGYQVKIDKINIGGNASFKDRKLKKQLKSKTSNIFRGGYLKEDLLKEDMERLTAFYEQNGYIDARVSYNVEHLVKGKVLVNISIEEGKRYKVGDVFVEGNEVVSEKEIRRAMRTIEEGNIFSREKLKLDVANIRTLYFDRGYIFAAVNEASSLDGETGMVEVKINIQEGGLAYIERVKVQGNTRTRDIVVRRELRLYPGDRFDGSKLRRSKERLSNLGYFEDVSFDIEDTDTFDRKNLVVQVKEAKTGSFSFGGGFSTVDRVVGFIEVEQRNFDITNWPTFVGGGQRLQVRAETGSSKNNLLLSFTEPWVFDRPISFGFDLYARDREREDDTGYAYDEERVGGKLRLSKQFGEFDRAGISYKWEEVEISNFEPGVSAALLAEAGTNAVSVFGINYTHDERDSVFNPRKGWVFNSGFDIAGGILGADKDFYRVTLGGSYYVPLAYDSVLEFRARTGIVDAYGDSSSVPIFERFFAGGASSIRGYEQRGVGPQDATTKDPIGGESMIVSTVEYTVPLLDFLKLAVFVDSGGVWEKVGDYGDSGFKTGAGVGARIKTPIGPISLDYGYPLNDEPGEEDQSGKFYFNVSRGF